MRKHPLNNIRLIVLLLALLLSACDTLTPATPTPTPQAITKLLATVYISPTPNPEQAEATRRAISPTPRPPTATVEPSVTPFVGSFIGRAERDAGFVVITTPLFIPQAGVSAANTCPTPIGRDYVAVWSNQSQVAAVLGCPIQESFGFFGQVQVFERGVMYLQPDIRAVWALVPAQSRYWYVEAPTLITTEGVATLAGLIVPNDDFGSVWMGVAGLRGQIGYAVTERQEAAFGLQRMEGGSFLLDATSGQVFALGADGTVWGPFIAPERPLEEATPTATLGTP